MMVVALRGELKCRCSRGSGKKVATRDSKVQEQI